MLPATEDGLRRVLRRFASGVWVVTVPWNGQDHAMTATAVCSVSLDPLLMLVSVHQDSRVREALDASPRWGLTLLDGSAATTAEWLASPGRPVWGQLDRVEYERGEFSGAALPTSALAWMECETDAIHRAGDHDLVVGRIVTLASRPEPDGPRSALVHYRGAFRSI